MFWIILLASSPRRPRDHRDDVHGDNPGREAARRVASLDEGTVLPRVRRMASAAVGTTCDAMSGTPPRRDSPTKTDRAAGRREILVLLLVMCICGSKAGRMCFLQ